MATLGLAFGGPAFDGLWQGARGGGGVASDDRGVSLSVRSSPSSSSAAGASMVGRHYVRSAVAVDVDISHAGEW